MLAVWDVDEFEFEFEAGSAHTAVAFSAGARRPLVMRGVSEENAALGLPMGLPEGPEPSKKGLS